MMSWHLRYRLFSCFSLCLFWILISAQWKHEFPSKIPTKIQKNTTPSVLFMRTIENQYYNHKEPKWQAEISDLDSFLVFALCLFSIYISGGDICNIYEYYWKPMIQWQRAKMRSWHPWFGLCSCFCPVSFRDSYQWWRHEFPREVPTKREEEE